MFPGGRSPFAGFFNDPFMRDPFQHMNDMMNHMFNDPFFGPPPNMRAGAAGHAGPRGSGHHAAPVIEEVDGHSHGGAAGQGYARQPIVEEPDDDPSGFGNAHGANHGARGRGRHVSPSRAAAGGGAQLARGGGAGGFGFAGFGFPGFDSLDQLARSGNGQVFSYSSSTVQTGGPGGVSYQATQTSRTGPGGVREVQKTVRDGRTGHEAISVARALGDRERVITRTRDASGREQRDDILKGVGADEADRFDREWMEQARQRLPAFGSAAAGAGRLEGGRAPAHAYPALPSSSHGLGPGRRA